jgi:2-succinyl-6-hydroxy-2,4-cyclohexadiene-1-carboxylate synthase
MSETVVLLHGFAGTRRSWERVAVLLEDENYRPLALDIRGHGERGADRPVSFAACVSDIAAQAPERFVLCGYSLGGRLALHAALALGDRVSRLVIVSASAGIVGEAQRTARREADERLARMLDRGELDAFISHWRALPLFAEDPSWLRDEVEADQRRNTPGDLAAALRGLGAGSMAPLWGRLGELAMDMTVLVGEYDAAYRALAEGYSGAGKVRVVAGAGHRLALQSPAAVAAACVEAGPR